MTRYASIDWTSFSPREIERARHLVSDQRAPIKAGGQAIWPLVSREMAQHPRVTRLVLADMIARDEHGRLKYGEPLTGHNGRDHLVDAYQEALDLTAYTRAEIDAGDPVGAARILYNPVRTLLCQFRGAIALRDRES